MKRIISALMILSFCISCVPFGITASAEDTGALTVITNPAYTLNTVDPYLRVIAPFDDGRTIEQQFSYNNHKNGAIDFRDVIITDLNGNQTTVGQGGDNTAPFKINFLYYGANHGPHCARLTVAGHGLDNTWVGTQWKATGSEDLWTLVKIDGNYLYFMSNVLEPAFSSTPTKKLNWVHPSRIDSTDSKMVCQDDGYAKTITYSAMADGQQLFPITKNHVRTITAYTDGVATPVDITAAGEIKCDKLVLNESYILTDPRQLSQLIQGYKGSWTPEIGYALGDNLIKYHQIITVMSDGTVLTEYDHEVLMDIPDDEMYQLIDLGITYLVADDFASAGKVYRYMPGTKVYSGVDFSVPTDIYSSYLNGELGSLIWGEGNTKIPRRVVDYMKDGSGNTFIAQATGLLPVNDGAYENRKNNIQHDASYHFYSTKKNYLYVVNRKTMHKGDTIKAVNYRKFENTAKESETVQTYTVSHENDLYYYMDFLANTKNQTFKLPKNFDAADFTVSDVSTTAYADEVKYTVNAKDNTITINSANQKAYLVLKSKQKENVDIAESWCDASGKVNVSLVNDTSSSKTVTAICVGYEDGVLRKVGMKKDLSLAKGSNPVVFDDDFGDSNAFRVMLFNSISGLKPLTNSKLIYK